MCLYVFALFILADTSTAHAGCSESELAFLSLANCPRYPLSAMMLPTPCILVSYYKFHRCVESIDGRSLDKFPQPAEPDPQSIKL